MVEELLCKVDKDWRNYNSCIIIYVIIIVTVYLKTRPVAQKLFFELWI